MATLWKGISTAKVVEKLRKVLWPTALFGTGLALKEAINWPYDYILYPAVIIWKGPLVGGAIMIFLSIFYDLWIIRAYDWAKTDWFYIEKLKEIRETDAQTRWGRWFRWFLKKGNVAMFFFLCVKENPATVVIYFRKGSFQYNGMKSRDWKIFFASVVVANLVYIAILSGIIEVTWYAWSQL